MFEINYFNVVVFAVIFLSVFYIGSSLVKRSFIKLDLKKIILYVTTFSLLGLVGELFVNTSYQYITGNQLWEYRLLPAHNGSVSYFFIFVWGSLGFYKYISEIIFPKIVSFTPIAQGILIGTEAIFIELLYNGLYFLCFNDYIFYYFPNNLGFFAHLSCLQVIPFYFLFGFAITKLLKKLKNVSTTFIVFHWFIIITLVMIG